MPQLMIRKELQSNGQYLVSRDKFTGNDVEKNEKFMTL